ncbi:MAG: hypothetical protein B6D55_04160 [Candidatus Omnitrophica bacterium 4484_70.2]|nr:MAG: hypothetical protein B6D55_04160 [Candidatus Omnitrophica bacterium 4484_70.2]
MEGKLLDKYKWDIYFWVLFIFIVIFQIGNSFRYPQFLDEYFHILRGKSLEYWGGFPLTEYFELAPVGRPNLYPPLYHLLLLFLHKLGVDWLQASKIMSIIVVPFFCVVYFYVLKKMVSSCAGFFFVLVSFSTHSFFLSLVNNIPATLSLVWMILAFYFMNREKICASAVFLSLSFYTHPFLGYLVLFSLLLYSIFLFRKGLRAILWGLILSAPFIYHQFRYIELVNWQPLYESKTLEFNIFIILSFLGGLRFVCKNKRYLYFVILVILSVLSMGGGGYFYRLLSSQFSLFESTFDNLFKKSLKSASLSIWFPKYYLPVKKVILRHTQENDIIYSNIPALGVLFSCLCGRPTTCALFREVGPFYEFDRIENASLCVILKSASFWENIENLDKFAERNFKLVGENELFYIFYRKPKRRFSLMYPLVVNLKYIYLILAVYTGIILEEVCRK